MTNAEIDSVAERIVTAHDARVVLVRAQEYTVEGYRILADLSALPPIAGTREEARSALELVDQRIEQVRAELPATGSQELTEFERRRVAGTVLYARDTLRTISGQTSSVLDDILESLRAGFDKVGETVSDVASSAGVSAWVIAVPVLAVIIGLLLLRRSA